MHSIFFKRLIDLVLSFVLLIMFLPLLIVISLVLLIANEGKPFYLQKRPGKNEKIFTLIKFKTMNDNKDKNGVLLPPEQRVTSLGRVIRALSIDELPQLINVLKGDMSLIGPRPLLVEYLPLYDDFQRQRHKVLPGITGWAQVNGRNVISWEKRFEFDVYYANNISFALDIKIVWLTLKKVITREGVNKSENITMEKFEGSSKN